MGLLKAEVFRLSQQSLLRAAVAALLLLVVLRGVVWPPDATVRWSGLWSFAPVTLTVMIIAAVTVGQEFTAGTFRALITRGVARWHFVAVQFVALAILGGLLLAGIEAVITALGVRQGLHAGELLRAWLALWPHIALVMLLAIAARSGGLAFVVGVLQLALEQMHAALMATFSILPEQISGPFRILTHLGLSGDLFQWSLTYNSANWTYLAEAQRAPMPVNVLLYALPNSTIRSGLLLAGYTLLGLGVSTFLLYRRDMVQAVESEVRLWGLRPGRMSGTGSGPSRVAAAARLPAGTARGPLLMRLVRAHLFQTVRTSLVRVSAAVPLLLPLALWWAGTLAKRQAGSEPLWSYGPGGVPPLAFVLSLLVVGPLSTVVSALAVSNEFVFGTRRADLARGAGRALTIVAQSLALLLGLGAMLALMAGTSLLIGAGFVRTWYPLPAIVEVAAGTFAAAVYVAAVQVGGALTRSPTGALLFGLGLLVADSLLILAPTLSTDPGWLGDLSRYSVTLCTLAVASWGRLDAFEYGWRLLDLAPSLLLLAGYAGLGHLLAIVVAQRRDA